MAVLEIQFKGQDGVASIVNNITAEIHELNQTTNQAKESGQGFFSGLLQTAGGFLAANVIGNITSQVKDFIGSSIADAREANGIFAQTEAAIKSTGGAAGYTAEQIRDMAGSMSAAAGKSLFDDDDIQKGDNLLLTFTNIKETLPNAQQAMVDMATAMHTDVSAGAIQLGKALNDPEKGITALTRVGVTFTESQKDQIKALQESGDMAGAQTIILNELNKEFGGSATAAAKADGGMAQFKAQLGDVGKQIGGALLPAIGQLTSFATTSLMPVLSQFADWFAAKLPVAIGYVTQTVIPAAIQAWQQLQPAIQTAGAIFLQVSGVITAVANTLTSVLSSHADQIQSVLITHWQAIQSSVGSVVGALWSVISAVFSQVQTFLQGNGAQIMSTLISDWAQIQGAIDAATRAISSIITTILSAVATFIQNHGAQIQAFMQTAWAQISDIVRLAIQLINATIVPALQFIAGFIQAHGAEIQAILGNTWQAITGIIDAALTLIKGVIQIALDLIHGNWQQAWEDLQQMSARIVQDLLQVIGAGLDNLKVLFSGAIDWITHAWDGLVGNMQQIGANIVDGIQHGVSNAWEAFKSWIHDRIMEIPEAVRNALDIHSPSTVMALTVGEPIVQGIVQGIMSNLPLIDNAMDDVSKRIVGSMQATKDMVHRIMTDILSANVSTARQAVGNLDTLIQLSKQAEDANKQAGVTLGETTNNLAKITAEGQAKIAEAQKAFDDAQKGVADQVAAAHDKYTTGIANTEGAIRLLNEKLTAAKQGTTAYDALMNQIAANQRKLDDQKAAQAKAETDAAASAQKAKDALIKAQNDAAAAVSVAQANYDAAQKASLDSLQMLQIAQSTQFEARGQLALAGVQAAEISKTNATAGAEYLAMRSQQIFELAGLEEQRLTAQAQGNAQEAAQLADKISLVKTAQAAELAQYQQHAADVVATMQKQVAGIVQQGKSAGESFVDGILQGIVENTAALGAGMTAAVQAAIDAVRAALDMHSPSRVAARSIGLPLIQGVAAGISGGTPLAAGAMQGAASAIVQAGQTTHNYYNLSYETRQSAGSIDQDIRLLSLLNG
jgi:phage-related protein